jgi:uncharacterized cupin superfamily protein
MTLTTCPSFIDLAAFARTAVAGADPFGADAALLPLRGGPVELRASLLSGAGEAVSLPGDTVLVVAEGEASITLGGATHALTKGESIVLSGPQSFGWSADSARLVTMRYTGGAAEASGVTLLDPTTERQPSGAPLAELLIGPTPQCHNHTQFLSADGEFMVGIWDSTPYHRRAMAYRHFELMYLLAGSVTFIDEEGREGTFRAGDLFLVEQGAQCSWESREDVTKLFAIYRPKA